MELEELRATLKAHMQKNKLTQEKVAAQSGVSQQILSNFLRGTGVSVASYTKLVKVIEEK